MTRGRARRYLLTKQGYYPGVVAAMGYDVWDWSTLNKNTMFQDSTKLIAAKVQSDPVGCWVDYVKKTDATQLSTPNKPGLALNSLNGLPTLSFDGNDLLATANISISTFAVWAVFKVSGTAGFVYEQSVTNATNPGMQLYTEAGGALSVNRSGTRILKSGQVLTDNTYRVVRVEHNGTYASLQYYGNNSELTTTTIGTPTDLGAAIADQPLYIGGRYLGTYATTGNIGQLLIMSPYPTDASILVNMSSYVNNQWNGVY